MSYRLHNQILAALPLGSDRLPSLAQDDESLGRQFRSLALKQQDLDEEYGEQEGYLSDLLAWRTFLISDGETPPPLGYDSFYAEDPSSILDMSKDLKDRYFTIEMAWIAVSWNPNFFFSLPKRLQTYPPIASHFLRLCPGYYTRLLQTASPELKRELEQTMNERTAHRI